MMLPWGEQYSSRDFGVNSQQGKIVLLLVGIFEFLHQKSTWNKSPNERTSHQHLVSDQTPHQDEVENELGQGIHDGKGRLVWAKLAPLP